MKGGPRTSRSAPPARSGPAALYALLIPAELRHTPEGCALALDLADVRTALLDAAADLRALAKTGKR